MPRAGCSGSATNASFPTECNRITSAGPRLGRIGTPSKIGSARATLRKWYAASPSSTARTRREWHGPLTPSSE
eukprot:13516734-Heterocapsa_arctica.AAC.1